MNIPLLQWIDENVIADTMCYKKAAEDQFGFMSTKIPRLLSKSIEEYLGIKNCCINVISTHVSKSILLPVYELRFRDCTFILRDNFYNWKISVKLSYKCPCLIYSDFDRLFNPEYKVPSVYCEGFHVNDVYGSFNEYVKEVTSGKSYPNRKFTVELYSQWEVYTFFYVLDRIYLTY